MDRRAFIKLVGLGAAGLVVPAPVRRYWQVPANAPLSGGCILQQWQEDERRLWLDFNKLLRERYAAVCGDVPTKGLLISPDELHALTGLNECATRPLRERLS